MNWKPATPLPWKTIADVVADEKGNTVSDCMGALEPRMKNSTYIAIACNAYPKLIELVADFASQGNRASTELLRELGEWN